MSARRPRVLVVGAGLAGLAAAWGLRRSGFDTAVCERHERPGGRVQSRREEGFCLDQAWPVLSSADRELLAWIGEIGAGAELLPLRPVVQAQVRGRRFQEVDSRSWIGLLRTPGIRPHQALRLLRLPRLVRRYAPHLDPAAPERAAPLDDRSLADFARLYFGNGVLEHWMAPAVAAGSLADPQQTSRALFLRHYWSHHLGRAGLPRAPLGELPEIAASSLGVRCGAEALRVEAPPGRPLRAILAVDGREQALEVDAVVVATSAPDAAHLTEPLLVGPERSFLEGTRYAASLLLAVGLRRPLHPHPLQVSVPRGAGSPLETLLLEPGVAGGRVPAGRGLALLRTGAERAGGGPDAPDETVAKELLDALAAFQPGARGAVLFTRVLREPRAHPCFDVGRYRELARFLGLQTELRRAGRRLYFAGDYLADPTWEGALISARRVCEALAEDFRAPGSIRRNLL
jgi:oxygen-dependent protoporphyrinogen oxidase